MQAVLVDTSVWIRLFRHAPEVADLPRLLRASMAHVHDWSLTELELGTGVPRAWLDVLASAPRLPTVPETAALALMRSHRLQRSGIGVVDLQLLAAAHARGAALWTADEALRAAAERAGLPRLRPSIWGTESG